MKKDKSFTDILARPGIALKLKALVLPSIRNGYERGTHYSLLPYGAEYLFAPKKDKEESEDTTSGLFSKLNSSLNKIAEKLFYPKLSNIHSYTNENTNNVHKEYSRVGKIISPLTELSFKINGMFHNQKKSEDATFGLYKNNSTFHTNNTPIKIHPLTSISLKANEMFRTQKPISDITGSLNKSNSIFTSNTTSTFNRINYPTITNSSVDATSILTKESYINLKDYMTGLNTLHNKREPIVKSNFVGVNPDRSFAKQKSNQYTITQNFGDIVIQPASMEMSVQQVKYKIEDVLRKVKNSLY